MKAMVANKKKQKKAAKKPSKSLTKTSRTPVKRIVPKQREKMAAKPSPVMSVRLSGHSVLPPLNLNNQRVFSIEIDSISGETTIGDLIVAFPRTRDILMKHGLRFDVEEAGYLYMTLNVFSAIHGVTSSNLIQELHTASKEIPPPPTPPLRAAVPPPTA